MIEFVPCIGNLNCIASQKLLLCTSFYAKLELASCYYFRLIVYTNVLVAVTFVHKTQGYGILQSLMIVFFIVLQQRIIEKN